jgi:Peptidase family M13
MSGRFRLILGVNFSCASGDFAVSVLQFGNGVSSFSVYPFFKNYILSVLDYGAIGSILGHELTHGFDNTGRLYDENGNYRPWWTNRTAVEYEKRTECFVQQYNKFRIPELHANV